MGSRDRSYEALRTNLKRFALSCYEDHYDALQDKKDKVTQKHLCKKFLEYSINEIDMLYN